MVTLSFIAILHGLVWPQRRQPLEHITQNEQKKKPVWKSRITQRVCMCQSALAFFS